MAKEVRLFGHVTKLYHDEKNQKIDDTYIKNIIPNEEGLILVYGDDDTVQVALQMAATQAGGSALTETEVQNMISNATITSSQISNATIRASQIEGAIEASQVEGLIPFMNSHATALPGIPTVNETEWTGSEVSISLNNYNSDTMALTGVTKGTDLGEYTAYVTPKTGYKWQDGSRDSVSLTWSIVPQKVTAPTVTVGTYTYNGNWQGPDVGTYDNKIVSVTGDSQLNAGTNYKVVTSLKDKTHYQWADTGNTTDKETTWSINKATVSIPRISGSNTFQEDGDEKSLSWTNYDSIHSTITGDAEYNEGSYTAVASLDDTTNYTWTDGTTANKTYAWTIEPGVQHIDMPYLNEEYPDYDGTDKYITTEDLTDFDSATMTMSGDTHPGYDWGEKSLTISLRDTTNTCWSDGTTDPITLSYEILEPPPLAEVYDHQIIKGVAMSNRAAEIWEVGDRADGLAFYFEGNVTGCSDLADYEWYPVLIGINHNSTQEGNGLHFGIISQGEDDIYYTIIDDLYNTSTGNNSAFHNREDHLIAYRPSQNRIRATVLPKMYAKIPEEWRAIMSKCNKWRTKTTISDTVNSKEMVRVLEGQNIEMAYNVANTDYLFIPSHFEVMGTYGSGVNVETSAYVQQYDFFKTAAHRKLKKHNDSEVGAIWNTSTAYGSQQYPNTLGGSTNITAAGASGYNANGMISYGVTPCFFIAGQ